MCVCLCVTRARRNAPACARAVSGWLSFFCFFRARPLGRVSKRTASRPHQRPPHKHPLSLFFNKEMELSLVGLQNAGKTSLVSVLAGGSFTEDMIPTVGFNMRKVTRGGVTIKLWDLGGQPRFRSMWERYCRGVGAIVFVADAADAASLDAARSELADLLARPSLAGTPLLVLANKNDLPGALPAADVADRLDLASLTGRDVAAYSISCKSQAGINLVLDWLTQHAK